MTEAKQYVLNRFPGAGVRRIGEIFRLEGVPGLVTTGIDEAAAWKGAADELSDPVLEAERDRIVLEKVLAAFGALGGQVIQPMALCKRLELDGYAASEAVSAVNAALAGGKLVPTPTGGLRGV